MLSFGFQKVVISGFRKWHERGGHGLAFVPVHGEFLLHELRSVGGIFLSHSNDLHNLLSNKSLYFEWIYAQNGGRVFWPRRFMIATTRHPRCTDHAKPSDHLQINAGQTCDFRSRNPAGIASPGCSEGTGFSLTASSYEWRFRGVQMFGVSLVSRHLFDSDFNSSCRGV